MNSRIIDSISNIDEDIVQKYFLMREELQAKRINSNRLKRWLVSIAACIMLIVSCTFIFQNLFNETPDIDNPVIDNPVIDDNKKMFETISNYDGTSVFDYYPVNEHSSFSKLKLIKVCDGIYADALHDNSKYVLVECIVQEDYYGSIEKGVTVTIPILLNTATVNQEKIYYNESDIKEFVSNYEYIFAYLGSGLYTHKNMLSVNENEIVTVDSLSTECSLSMFNLIPIKNNEVDLNGLITFLDDNNVSYLSVKEVFGFTKIIGDKTKEEELIENITQMHSFLTEKK